MDDEIRLELFDGYNDNTFIESKFYNTTIFF